MSMGMGMGMMEFWGAPVEPGNDIFLRNCVRKYGSYEQNTIEPSALQPHRCAVHSIDKKIPIHSASLQVRKTPVPSMPLIGSLIAVPRNVFKLHLLICHPYEEG